MVDRHRVVVVVAVVLAVGAFLGSAVAEWGGSAEPGTVLVEGPQRLAPEERVRVEVLNGGGVEGMALSGTDYLRDVGFDVVDFGNAASFDADSSVVIDRVGRVGFARAVADAMGIGTVVSEPDSNLFVDVTVVLGSRWERPEPPGEAAPEATPAWWDIRRFFRSGTTPEPSTTGEGGRMLDPAQERNRE